MNDNGAIIVTGATGFVGGSAFAAISGAGRRVVGLGRRAPAAGARNFLELDLAAGEWPRTLRLKASVVVHAAGLAHAPGASKDDFKRQNVTATMNAIRLAAESGAARFVLISSVSVYGPTAGMLVDETFPCRPEGAYGVSKREAEIVAAEECDRVGIELVVLRLATVIGAGDPGNTGRLIRAIQRGRFLSPGRLANRKTLISRRDAGEAVAIAAMHEGAAGGIYNVAADPVAAIEIVTAAYAGAGMTGPITVPGPLAAVGARLAMLLPGLRGAGAGAIKLMADDRFDGVVFRDKFGFVPSDNVIAIVREMSEAAT